MEKQDFKDIFHFQLGPSAIRDMSMENFEKYLFKLFGIFQMPERIPDKLETNYDGWTRFLK